MARKKITPLSASLYLPQFFAGLFFLTAAYLKWYQALFGAHRVPLSAIFDHWIKNNLALEFYRSLMVWSMPYADGLAWIVIVLQGIAGLLLILNWRVRLAGAIIFFVQINIYLATYHQFELRVLGSQALWMGLYFFATSDMRGKVWAGMTYLLVLLGFLHLYGRWHYFGDPSLANVEWQREYFAEFNMSAWPGLKTLVLAFSATQLGTFVWVSTWWVKGVLLLGMLTKYRLQFGAAMLVFILATTLVWLNTSSCEGVFWVLTLFLWVSHERYLQATAKGRLRSFLP